MSGLRSRELRPVAVGTGPGALDLLPLLRAALNGSGPALLPHAAGASPDADLHPGEPLEDDEDDPQDPTVVAVATSGSTGAARAALLPAAALLASVSATHDRLGGPGRWLLALPAEHVAGLQVLVRSLVARTTPVVLDLAGGFTAAAFAAAAAPMHDRSGRRYTSLVPTQLVRLLDAGGAPLAALAAFDAVLVGGAATREPLRRRAADAGVRLVTTYGSSETCGGCVYDGVPLDGVDVRVEEGDGRVLVAGPVLARGYRGGDARGAFALDGSGRRWLRTDDAGRLDPDGLLTVTGRLDDVVVTGGLKVDPAAVEAALLRLPGVAEAVVVGVPDPHWGRRVVAALVLRPGAAAPDDGLVRGAVAEGVAPHAAPRQVLVLDRLPLRGPGKPDRAAVARLAAAAERRAAAPA